MDNGEGAMPKGQARRLLAGVTRPLTRHEIARGYVYVSQDKGLGIALDAWFSVEVNGKVFDDKRIDVSGRVHIPRAFLEALGDSPVTIKIITRRQLRISTGKH